MTEFELIRTYFASQPTTRSDVGVGIGDDAALVHAPPGSELAMTADVLTAGVHFFDDADPTALGHKALAVNLSDLAAVGAAPAWFLLGLTLPKVDAAWLRAFAQGLHGLARRHNVQLVGGDTVRGPLSIAITAIGFVPTGQALLRAGARRGDIVYVTGTLGDAALALAARRDLLPLSTSEVATVNERLERPTPRVDVGIALRAVASSAIDVSDGLAADLGHILEASGVGARIALDALPVSSVYRTHLSRIGWDLALAGGDDYELCFTAPSSRRAQIAALTAACGIDVTAIGEVTDGGLEIRDPAGRVYRSAVAGHVHFRSTEM